MPLPPNVSREEVERWIGAVVVPPYRPPGGLEPDTPELRPSADYLRRFPPLLFVGFGRRLCDGATIDGLEAGARALADECEELSGRRPVFSADLERGAGYHLPGRTLLPPARTLAEAEAARPGSIRAAGYLTGLEARAAGIDLVLAPVLDVNSNPDNPIISVRAFDTEPGPVGDAAAAFLDGLEAAGAGASLKHYPGHGDTELDSHIALPRVERSMAELEALELAPWRGFFDRTEARRMGDRLTVMVGHLDVPALTGEAGLPATLSMRSNAWLAREGFEGVVLSDGLEMLAVADLPDLGVRALEAGCDGLLIPVDVEALAGELFDAVESGRLEVLCLRRAAERMERMATALRERPAPDAAELERVSGAAGADLGRELVLASLGGQPGAAELRGELGLDPDHDPGHGSGLRGLEIGGQADLAAALLAAGPDTWKPAGEGPEGSSLLACLGGMVLAGRGSAGAEGAVEAAAREAVAAARAAGRAVGLAWFGAPEALPAWARDLPHLWVHAPGPTTMGGLAAFLAPPV